MESETNHNGTTSRDNSSIRFRIFLASPGDVPLERKLAREAIEHIGSERRFRGRIELEIVAWDQPGAAVAMEAGLTPQEAIAQGLPKPQECDLAVVVLWSRIGTRLPADFELKADGSPYLSGTEWETLNALKGYHAQKKPSVWVYRKQGAPQFAADDPELKEKLDQWQKLQAFLAAFTNPDGSLAGGINTYASPDDFHRRFEQHLRDRLDSLLETLPPPALGQPERQADTPRWPDSPYPGLAAFTPEQAPIFFGRGQEIDQLLQQFEDPQVRFVAVVGVSGAGKSSLVMAGLLPRLRCGVVGAAPWFDLVFKPGERGGDPFLALAYAIKSPLDIPGQTEAELARSLQADPQNARQHLHALLTQQSPARELLLVVDQFEELFTQASADVRRDFLVLLDVLVAQPTLRVIVTLRADFYARAIQEATLARLLRRDRGTFPLDPPGVSAIHQMIVRPAEAAGVELEDELVDTLLDNAGQGPGAMALIAFTLNQLYRKQQADHTNTLSKAAYEAIGGVQGAVQLRAEAALEGLAVDLETALPRLFAHLVEVDEQEVATRRRALQSRLQGDSKTVADELIKARLLVSGEGEANQPTLEVAHEIVLSGWERFAQWIREHAETLRARRDLERVAGEWRKSGHHGSALRGGRLLQRYLAAAEPRSTTAQEYLQACLRRRTGQRLGYAALGMLALIGIGLLWHVNQSQYPPPLAAKALLVQIGIWPVTPPVMVPIPAGTFEMGGTGNADELPVHSVRFAKPFEMGKTEVTFAQYDLFAAATGRQKPNDQGWGRDDRPVINISWVDATAYAEWLSERTGLHYRLPSESEWEYAARAGTQTERYWPDRTEGETDPACDYANVFDKKNESRIKTTFNITWDPFDCEDEFPFTAPVGQFKANDRGLHDMLGNVWEWNQDCYQQSYDGAPTDGTAWVPDAEEACPLRVLRGGSWFNGPQLLRSANRPRNPPVSRSDVVGFRLARTL